MASNQFYLFKDRRFLPIFLVQFLGCLNDGILKNSLIILITFKLASSLSTDPYMLVMLANVIFIAPFIFLASIAGQVADRYERSSVVKIIKLVEIVIVALSIYGFRTNNLVILFTCIGLMGVHSTFFGPIKYSVLPDKLARNELLAANGFIEAGTFLSILFGTMLGGIYNFYDQLVITLAIITALSGAVASFFMPKSNNANPNIKLNANLWQETVNMIRYASSKKQVYLAILGISWFWFIGAAILAQIPSLTRNILGADEGVSNLFLATFSIGVGFGSFWCNRIFSAKITTKYVFLSALGISFFACDLYFASTIASADYDPATLKTIQEFLAKRHYWRILADLFFISAISGIYVVPLFALMQCYSAPAYRSRIIAANNLINSIFMASSTIFLSILFYFNFSIPLVILTISLLNLLVAIYIYQLIPNSKVVPLRFWRAIFISLFDLMYKIEVKGRDNLEKAGPKAVIIANHLSYIDPPLISYVIPDNIQFAINTGVAKVWWVKPFLKILKTYPIESHNPMAIKSLISEIKRNNKIVIFPEGRTSVTGSLMKIYEGPGMIADKADAKIIPIRVEGTQFTIFSKVRKLMDSRFVLRRKITITILPPVKLKAPTTLDSRERRRIIGQSLYDIMTDMMFESSNYKQTIFQSLIDAAKIYGRNKIIMQDVDNNSTNYQQLLLKSFIISDLIKRDSAFGERIGLMMPSLVGSAITFFGIHAAGRIPAMINFTSGASNIISACQTSEIKTIYTSKKFVEKANLVEAVAAIKAANIQVLYLENLRKYVTISSKIKNLLASFFPQSYYETICPIRNDQETGVILFTSGTEGKPKAVALSHRNLQANRCQVSSRIDFNPYDCAFNSLPLFHSFGLMGTLIMALSGVKTFFYPSPLHYRIIPEMVYDVGATIMFSTNTFLNGYANYAHSYDFYSLRYVFAGAEKLKQKTRQIWFEKFGVRIFEAYGVTEAAPGIAINTPMHDRPGSVGRILPGMEYYLQKIDGIEQGGKLCVKGANIMQGYIRPKNPGLIEKTNITGLGEGWYDTGDIVSIDQDKYITILGRQKRFAKIAGEMISLLAVEEMLLAIGENYDYAAVAVEDEKKGEQIILFSTNENLDREAITKLCREKKLVELYIPKIIIPIDKLPVLATGKLNYRLMVEIAKNKLALEF